MSRPTGTSTAQASTATRSKLLRLIATVVLGLIILVGVVVLITWLVIRPQRLVFSIEDGSVHNFKLSHDQLNATFDFVVKSYNPNRRVSIYYDSIEVSVAYDEQTMAVEAVQPFKQPHKNVSRWEVRAEAKSAKLVGSAYRNLRVERSSGQIELDVWVKARIRFKVGVWKSRHRRLRAFCSPVLFHFSKRPKSFEIAYCEVDL